MSFSSEAIFTAMTEAVQNDASLPSKFKGSVIFVVDGQECSVNLKTSPPTISEGAVLDNPDLRITVSSEVLQQLITKKLTSQQAFMRGKLKVKGNMGMAMKLNAVLSSTRKYLMPESKL